MSIITTAQWVPRGFAAPFPKKYSLDEAEYDRIAALGKLQLDDAQEDLREAEESGRTKAGDGDEAGDEMQTDPMSRTSKDDDLKEYDLEHYDDDGGGGGGTEAQEEGQTMGMFGNVKSLAYYESNDDDPYITLQDDEDEDDRQDLQIMATDNLILSAKVEDELAQLEVYVFEDEGDNLYVHHDLMLPAIPLCLEWLDMPVGKNSAGGAATGNFVAVGTMDPDIEIWDLDTIDCMYPNAILGQGGEVGEEDKSKKKLKKKKKKSKRANADYHVDAVLSLAANRSHRNLLASASADQTVKLWDLNTTKCAQSYSYHTDKVCSLAWSTAEPTVLLSGSYDGTVVAADMRAPGAKAPRWGVESDVENVRWDPHDGNKFFVSTDKGAVHYHDVRKAPQSPEATKSVWTLQAHDESVSSLDVNAVIPGFMATGSTDRTVKLWNISPTGPSMVVSRNLDVGKVFAATFAPDAPVAFRLAVAGSSGSMHVWDTSTNAAVRKAFAHRMPARSETEAEDRLIGIEDDDASSSSDDGEGTAGDSMDED